jgi:flagellar FliL protein
MATTTKQSKPDPKAPAQQEPGANADEAAAPARKKRGLLKIVLLLTLLLGSAGGGAWYFLQEHEPAAEGKPGTAKAAKAAKAAAAKPPVFVTLESFTVNLQHDEAASQFLQVGLALKVNDAAVVDAVKLRTPEIRNRVLLLLSSKKASDISTLEGKQSLSAELMREISLPLAGAVAAAAIDSVLFTSFVIQ